MRRVFISLVVLLILAPLTAAAFTPTYLVRKADRGKQAAIPFSLERNQLIAYILGRQLMSRHYGHEGADEELARRMYDLYLRQLDPRKRFLLQADVAELDHYRSKIPNELRHGAFRLPDEGRRLLDARIREVDRLIDPILDAGFDFAKPEDLESDAKKLDYVADMAALRERWRIALKMQVLDSFFELLEDRAKEDGKKAGKAKKDGNGDADGAADLALLEALDADPTAHPEALREAVEKVRASSHRALQRLLKQDRQDHYDRYFDAAARAFDPHTNYMPPESKEDFDIQMSGSLEGIGALLREDEGRIKVVRVMPGSPAQKQGQLQAEDTILTVAEKGGEPVDIAEMRIREAVRLIRGPKGSEVILGVRKPDGGKMNIPIVRDVVQLEESYVKSALLETEDGKAVGFIRIPSFYRDFEADDEGRNATADTRAAIEELKKKGMSALILDLRNNGGGALEDAVQISGLFLPGGPVVQVKDGDGKTQVRADEDKAAAWEGPLIVLVNQFSASASEIVAAAMQDYGRALIIGGRHTHGKGTVQSMMDLNRYLPLFRTRKVSDLGALKLTIQKFYRVNGGSTQFKGVEPDLVAPSMLDHLESGEQHMDYPLPWDQVLPVPFRAWEGSGLDRDDAVQRGEAWIAASDSFKKIASESEKAKNRAERTRVAVSAADMWRERRELARAREEAKAAGLLESTDGDEDGDADKDDGKKLEESLAKDPYVRLCLELFAKAKRGSVAAR